MVKAIVAADKAWGIGYDNKLLCHIPADLKRFKEITEGNVVIMGSKTFESIGSVPLPNRINIVVTYDYSSPVRDSNGVIYMDMKNVVDYILCNQNIKGYLNRDIYIIGGASIYKQLLAYCDEVLVTRIDKVFENADTFFPDIDDNPQWELSGGYNKIYWHEDIAYKYLIYKKVNNND